MSRLIRERDEGPWYREPWPWLLMAGPFVVVIAGLVTAWIAVSSDDGLVSEDYYRKGLAVNQTIARSERAAASGLQAALSITAETLSLRLTASAAGFALPPRIVVILSHPTRAGLDQTRTLALDNGRYSGEFRLPAAGHWLILVEDDAATWRLMGNVVLPASGEIMIGEPAAQR